MEEVGLELEPSHQTFEISPLHSYAGEGLEWLIHVDFHVSQQGGYMDHRMVYYHKLWPKPKL